MNDMRLKFEAEMTGLAPDDWYARLEEIADDLGYYEPLGKSHCAAFLDAGTNLYVTFENAETIQKSNAGAEPRGFHYTRQEGWSHLAIISDGESWFRDPAIYRYFDRLIDDGFFEDFDNVLFHGANAGGYAAAAYSVAAPGCTVLAIRPQATLDPRVTGWDVRYTDQRRKNFTDRYGYAPDMIDAADHTFILFDPLQRLDAGHVAMFTKPAMTPLRCMALGNKIDIALDAMGVHDDLIVAAMTKTLTEGGFNTILRARRDYALYLRSLYLHMIKTDHPVMAANVCAYVLRKEHDTFFAKKLQELTDQGHTPSKPLKYSAA